MATEKLPKCHSEWLPVLMLVLLVIPLRGWLMWNTEVLARDGVVYINYAMQIEQLSWRDALVTNHHHPGYPLTIWAVSIPVRYLLGPADSFIMQLSAQLASNLAAVLLIFPMYFIGRFFFERRVAFWGTLLFQYLPVSGQHLSDGVSEALFLLLINTAFLCSLWALRRQSLILFIGCGVFCGLAYLTRPEGALIVISTLMVLAIGPLMRGWHQTWKINLRSGLVMTLAGLAVGSLYFGVTGTFTNKPSFWFIRGEKPKKDLLGNVTQNGPANVQDPASAGPLFASIFGNVVEQDKSLMRRLGKGLFMFGAEYFQIFHYLGFLALLFGTIRRAWSLFSVPEFLVPCLFALLQCMLVLALACGAGYLSNRHLLAVAVWGAFFAAAGLCDFPRWLAQWWFGEAGYLARRRMLKRVALLLLVAFIGLCLPKTTQKLHANQVGNHLAGLWLAEHRMRGDTICDNHFWSQYYAGELFRQPPDPPPGRTKKCFVVMTRSRDAKTQQKQLQQVQQLRQANAEVVYHWPETAPEDLSRVVVFAVDNLQDRWWYTPR